MTRHPLHASLVRSPLLAGAEPGFVVLEVCLILALLTVVGLHFVTVALALFWGTAVHGLFVWIAAKDPLASALYLRSLRRDRNQDYTPALARLIARPAPVPPLFAKG